MWKFMGFPRADGSVGIRNHIMIIGGGPVAANAAYRAARMVAGTTLVVTRLEYVSEAEDLYDILRHPNVAGYVVIVEDPINDRVEDTPWKDLAIELERNGKPHSLVVHKGSTEVASLEAVEELISIVMDQSEARRQLTRLTKLSLCFCCFSSQVLADNLHALIRDLLAENGTILWLHGEGDAPTDLPKGLGRYLRGQGGAGKELRLSPGLRLMNRPPSIKALVQSLMTAGVQMVLRPKKDGSGLLHPLIPSVEIHPGEYENGVQGERKELLKDGAGLLVLNTILATASGRVTREEASGGMVVF